MRTPQRSAGLISLGVACLSVATMFLPGRLAGKVTDQEVIVDGPLPEPKTIWVYDFVATPDELPADSDLAEHYDPDGHPPQTDEQLEQGRKLGALIAHQLVKKLKDMGMNAEPAMAGDEDKREINDLVIRGCLISFDEGDAKKRVLVGLGKGEAELQAAVEGFQVTAEGLRRLGRGASDTHSGKSPGVAVGAVTLAATKNPVGLVVSTGMKVHGERSGSSTVEGRAEKTGDEIAKALKKRFVELGWIKEDRRLLDGIRK